LHIGRPSARDAREFDDRFGGLTQFDERDSAKRPQPVYHDAEQNDAEDGDDGVLRNFKRSPVKIVLFFLDLQP
jgi:hypothetical protein